MESETIELQSKWRLGPEIVRGGFGHIHEGWAEDGSQVVIKLVPQSPGASRELLFEPISGLPNIIPVLDSGEWQDSYVLVMPRAEKSLRQHLGETGGKLTLNEGVSVLLDVAEALSSLRQDVVHRDLKPENILLFQGHWCLADFGIARYAEATTAPDTHKHAFTPAYAAPEQWRAEHATPATDVYAFGVMAFELLQGHRPFLGPASSDYRKQHLTQASSPLAACPPSIATLVTECLYKAPQARPTPANILARLRSSLKPASPASAQLQAANQMIVVKEARLGAVASAQKSSEEKRKDLFTVAQQSLEAILDRLSEQILEAAPAAAVSRTPNLVARLGEGVLTVDTVTAAPSNCLAAYSDPAPFDVIAYTAITVRKSRDRFGYDGRSHSLWFCDAHDEGVYRWFELAFMVQPLIPEVSSLDPFALAPTTEDAAEAFSPVMSVRQLAWEPVPFDQGGEEQFIERWLSWYAEAVGGTLCHPSSMPEHSGGRHRHSSAS